MIGGRRAGARWTEKERKLVIDYVKKYGAGVPIAMLGRELKEELHRGAEAIAGQIYIMKKEGRL